MTDIILTAHRLSWSAPLQHGSEWDKSRIMKKMRPQILERDNYTCQGCGWVSKKYQEIHHINHDHGNFKEKNLETLCPLCHQVFHPVSVSVSNGGEIIWLPELSQVDLNKLLFGVFSVLKTGQSHPLFAIAKSIYGILEMRKVYLKNQLGKIDPAIYGQLLLNLNEEDFKNRHQLMRPLKLMANPSRFEIEIEYWKTMYLQEKEPLEWVSWAQSLNIDIDKKA